MVHGQSDPRCADKQETLTSREVARYNEGALTHVLADVQFIEQEVKRLGRAGLDHVFDEVKMVGCDMPF